MDSMNAQIPAAAAQIIDFQERCSVPVGGYGPSSLPNVFTRDSPELKDPKLDIRGEGGGVWVAEDSYVHIDGQIIGKNSGVIVGPNCRLRKIIVRIKGDNCFLIFGAGSTTEAATFIVQPSNQHIVFGDDCMVSSTVVVRTDDGHSVYDRRTRQRLGGPASVNIGAHVWLGNGSRVNKGVNIGGGAILGQLGLATRDMDANASYAGVPAKLVREDIAWSRTQSFADIPDYAR